MECVISMSRLVADLAALTELTPAALVEVIGGEAREALGGERLTPQAIAEASGVLRIALAGLAIDRDEADGLVARLAEMLTD